MRTFGQSTLPRMRRCGNDSAGGNHRSRATAAALPVVGEFRVADNGKRCGQSLDSMISAGCIISGSTIRGSVLCPNVRVHSFCVVEDSILMPGVRVGRHARIRRAIVDRDVFIPRGAHIGFNDAEDRKRHTVTESGIVVVTKNDEPFLGTIGEDALRVEAEFDYRGAH